MTNPTDLMEALTKGLPSLPPSDRTFAASLIASVKARGLPTEKQSYWLNRMLARTQGQPTIEKEAIGDLAGIMALFRKVAPRLKSPAIVLGYQRGHERRSLRITVAGSRARVPGSLNVADLEAETWFGRIHQDGTFEHSRRDSPPAGVSEQLRRFSADPAQVAAEHGRLTGRCCFCHRPLTDDKSTAVGYGPTCAEHYGLPYGATTGQTPLELLELDDFEDPDADGYGWERRALAGAGRML